MKLRAIFIVGILLLALPCFGAETLARVFVYYPWDSLQRSRITISFDEVPVAEVQPGRFFLINLTPGSHVVIPGDGMPLVVEARAGEESFVLVAREIEMSTSGKRDVPVLAVLSKEQARLDMVNLLYVVPKKIFSDSVSKEDPFLHQRPNLKTRHPAE